MLLNLFDSFISSIFSNQLDSIDSSKISSFFVSDIELLLLLIIKKVKQSVVKIKSKYRFI